MIYSDLTKNAEKASSKKTTGFWGAPPRLKAIFVGRCGKEKLRRQSEGIEI